jgi:hypothetical protein
MVHAASCFQCFRAHKSLRIDRCWVVIGNCVCKHRQRRVLQSINVAIQKRLLCDPRNSGPRSNRCRLRLRRASLDGINCFAPPFNPVAIVQSRVKTALNANSSSAPADSWMAPSAVVTLAGHPIFDSVPQMTTRVQALAWIRIWILNHACVQSAACSSAADTMRYAEYGNPPNRQIEFGLNTR